MTNQYQTPWTDLDADHLKMMWKSGKSAKECARFFGRTRNAIIGKLDRMGLLGRPDADRLLIHHNVNHRYDAVSARPPMKKRKPLAGKYRGFDWSPPPNHEQGNVPLWQIRSDQCRYIASGTAGAETLMCGEPVFSDPYCGFHHELCRKKTLLRSRAVASEVAPSRCPPSEERAASL